MIFHAENASTFSSPVILYTDIRQKMLWNYSKSVKLRFMKSYDFMPAVTLNIIRYLSIFSLDTAYPTIVKNAVLLQRQFTKFFCICNRVVLVHSISVSRCK